MKVEAALGHWSSPCAPHHAETRLCISLPFSISFIANIARKRPELKRDKTKPYAYLKATLEAIAQGHPASRIDELMPWNFKTDGQQRP